MTRESQYTYVLILDDDVIEFLNCQAGTDINRYLNRLLREEKERQHGRGTEDLDALVENAPDATMHRY